VLVKGLSSAVSSNVIEHMSESAGDITAHGPADGSFDEELAQLAAGVRAWAAQDLSLVPVVMVPRRVEILLRMRNEIEGELLRELQSADRSGEAARLGGGSTVGWLADMGRLDHRHASALVRTARGLVDRLPATAKALSEGDITLQHAQVLNRAVTPARVALAQQSYAGGVAQAEDDLLTVAILACPETTHRAAQSWVHALDPQAEARTQAQQHEARELYLDRTFDGMVSINGRLDREAGDILLTAIGALATPRTGSDLRTSPQRRADALLELCQQVLATGELPDVAGERPHLNVTVSFESLELRAGATAAQLGPPAPSSARPPAAWRAMPASAGSSPTARARSSTSGAAPAPSTPRCAAPWSFVTRGVCTPAAIGRPPGAKAITSSTGSTEAPPTWTTWYCCAAATTVPCTKAAASCTEDATADGTSTPTAHAQPSRTCAATPARPCGRRGRSTPSARPHHRHPPTRMTRSDAALAPAGLRQRVAVGGRSASIRSAALAPARGGVSQPARDGVAEPA